MLMLWVVATVAKVNICMLVNQPWLRAVFGLTSPIQPWWGIEPVSASVFGVPVRFAVTILVSLVTPKTDQKFQDLAEYIRYPDLKKPLAGAIPNSNRVRGIGFAGPQAQRPSRGKGVTRSEQPWECYDHELRLAAPYPTLGQLSSTQKESLCVTMRSSC